MALNLQLLLVLLGCLVRLRVFTARQHALQRWLGAAGDRVLVEAQRHHVLLVDQLRGQGGQDGPRYRRRQGVLGALACL